MAIRRRELFRSILGAGALAALGPAARLLAAPGAEHRFVHFYFNGAWDVLLGLDPREPGTYAGLDVGTDRQPAEFQTPVEARLGTTDTIFGAPLGSIVAAGHDRIATVFRSVNMNTVAHQAGRSYVNTFRSPAGTVARGSSIGTLMSTAGDLHEGLVMPNVSLGMPTFNTEHAADFTGVRTALATEMRDLISFDDELRFTGGLEDRLRAAQDAARGCVGERYRGERPEDALRESRERVRRLEAEDLAAHFDLDDEALRAQFGIPAGGINARHPAVVAAITHQLMATGLSRSVTAQIQVGLDTHNTNWTSRQGPLQRDAWNAVSRLLDAFRADDPNLENTTVVCTSEFARTPRINGNGGRDHWFANSMIVFGGKLRKGVCGATGRDNLGLQKTDLETGLPDTDGTMLTPELVGATIAASVGLDTSSFRVSPMTSWISA